MRNDFQEINHHAAADASQAMSKLIGRAVEVGIRTTEIKKVRDVVPLCGAEELVAGVYMSVTGDVEGASLLVLPQETAFALSDLLVGRTVGTTRTLNTLDKSALKEVGNIVFGNYLTVLANALNIKIIEQVPDFSWDMFGAILGQIIARFAQDTEDALVIDIEFVFGAESPLQGYFLLLFEAEQFDVILRDLEVGAKSVVYGPQ